LQNGKSGHAAAGTSAGYLFNTYSYIHMYVHTYYYIDSLSLVCCPPFPFGLRHSIDGVFAQEFVIAIRIVRAEGRVDSCRISRRIGRTEQTHHQKYLNHYLTPIFLFSLLYFHLRLLLSSCRQFLDLVLLRMTRSNHFRTYLYEPNKLFKFR
jgi:hypothetical protein